jgi:hypothetical protein
MRQLYEKFSQNVNIRTKVGINMLKKVSPQVQNIQVKKKYEQEAVGTIAYFCITRATSNNSSTAVCFWCCKNVYQATA